MYDIKAHEVIYRGAHFRSKNECKRYIFLKKLGWNVEYEPVLEDIKGWLPDMIIFGKSKKILVEVKPFQILKDFNTKYAKETYAKINKTEWWNNYDAVLVFGSSLNLGEVDHDDTFLGGYIFRTDDHIKNEAKDQWSKINSCEEKIGPYWSDNFVYTTRDVPEGHVDVCDHFASFQGIVHDSYDGGYWLTEDDKIKIETAWNHAGSEMRYVKRVA
tara:strand:+ start:82 stop:726 length:645 start_codon:yes stop_codon:yes gene_type:complete